MLTYAVRLIPSIEHSAFLHLPLHSLSSLIGEPTVGCRRPRELRQCPSVSSRRDALASPHVEPVSSACFQRWLMPLVELTRKLVGAPLHPWVLTRFIEEGVSVQVNKVTNSEPRCHKGCYYYEGTCEAEKSTPATFSALPPIQYTCTMSSHIAWLR